MDLDIATGLLFRFVVAALIGLLIGLERGMKAEEQPHAGIRDFVLFALAGALFASAAEHFQNAWVFVAGLFGILVFLVSGYWAQLRASEKVERGITTEISGLLTFLLGGAAMVANLALTVAFSVVILIVLSQKLLITRFQQNIHRFEIDATLKLLVITFIVLPILPNTPLDAYLTFPMGKIVRVDEASRQVSIDVIAGQEFEKDQVVKIYSSGGRALGTVTIAEETPFGVRGQYEGEYLDRLRDGDAIKKELGLRFLTTMATAINPFKVWVIVILVSFISFIGYVLVKILGAGAGIGLTGLVGGLASSTVTALSFAKRSLESPALNGHFAMAVILASTVMFPRLILQIAVVNQTLMQRMAVPLLVMAATGFVIAGVYYVRTRRTSADTESLSLDNPFSLSSALKFAAVFASVLVATQLAIAYLGNAWLPVVALVSGLTDADAIAFSLSAAQTSGQISADWAAFNLVLGAVSNTFTKLFLILGLGDRGLFKSVLVAFLILGTVGLATAFLYYDLSAIGANLPRG